MQNYQIKTIRYQTHLTQQGSALIITAVALFLIAATYLLFTRWGWGVVVGALIIAGISGLATLEYVMRQQQDEEYSDSNNLSTARRSPAEPVNKKDVKTSHADVNHTLSIDSSDVQAALEEDIPPLLQPQAAVAIKQYRLELVNPGKEPVQVMRVLHNDFGFPADQAKRVILDQAFPIKLGQGEKDLMQERARGLLKAGAKLRLVHCRVGAGAAEDGSTSQINQRAV